MRRKMVNAGSFSSRFKERSRAANSKTPEREPSRSPAAASGGSWRTAPPPPISKSKKANRRQASLSASTGDLYLPRAASAPARSKYKEHGRASRKCQSAHLQRPPRPAVSIGARRSYPIAPRRRRRLETAGRGVLARVRARSCTRCRSLNCHRAAAIGTEKKIPRQFERVMPHARRATVNTVLRRAQSDFHNRSRSPSKAQQ
jgi:hypothetical protein